MTETSNCPECGALLPANGPRGLCSKCALDRALGMTHGNSLGPEHLAARNGAVSGNLRLVDSSGALVGIGEWQAGGLLHPAIVLM